MQNLQRQNNKNNKAISFGVIIAILGICLLSSNYVNLKIDNAYGYMNNLLLERDSSIYDIDEEVDNLDEESASSLPIEENNNTTEEYVDPYEKYYIGKLEISKINLIKGFTAIDSPHNTVSKNIEVIKGSNYPDVPNGNFIIAAHSGSSYLAYFKNLYQLTNGDTATVTYKSVKYTYRIVNIYEQEKNGTIAIYRDNTVTTMTLVTCTKDVKTKQTVYILELIEKETI